jgi:hypothetical protein
MDTDTLQRIKKRVRLLQLLSAAENAALTPIELRKLHSFAYLADVLSPVWMLLPFEARLAKTGKSPYFPDLQRELDILVGCGMVEVSHLDYTRVGSRVGFSACFALRYDSKFLADVLDALEEDSESKKEQEYLGQLANALATLRDEDIAAAATEDASYSDPALAGQDYIELADRTRGASRTERAVSEFGLIFPTTQLPPARRLYMYAHYLGRKANARG